MSRVNADMNDDKIYEGSSSKNNNNKTTKTKIQTILPIIENFPTRTADYEERASCAARALLIMKGLTSAGTCYGLSRSIANVGSSHFPKKIFYATKPNNVLTNHHRCSLKYNTCHYFLFVKKKYLCLMLLLYIPVMMIYSSTSACGVCALFEE